MHGEIKPKYPGRLRPTPPEDQMPEIRKVMRVGGSTVVALPKAMRQALGIKAGDSVKITFGVNQSIVLQKERNPWDEGVMLKGKTAR